jgi:hypothetical protein
MAQGIGPEFKSQNHKKKKKKRAAAKRIREGLSCLGWREASFGSRKMWEIEAVPALAPWSCLWYGHMLVLRGSDTQLTLGVALPREKLRKGIPGQMDGNSVHPVLEVTEGTLSCLITWKFRASSKTVD